MGDSIAKKVMSQLGQIGTETVEKTVEETGKIVGPIITGKELLGDIKPMGEGEYMQKKSDDDLNRQEEINRLKAQMGQGRNVEQEMEKVRKEREEKEKQEEKEFLENIQRQREAEAREREAMAGAMPVNPHKAKKSRGSAFAHGKKKKGMPDMQQLSQTGEIKGKID